MNKYFRYLIGFSSFIITLILGILYAWGVFVPTLQNYFKWNRSEVMIPFSIASLVFAFFMIPAGKLQDKKGPKLVTILGGIFFGLGYILSSTSTHLWQLSLYFGVISGIGVALGYSGAVAGGIKWFPDLKGTATGILVGGFGLGALVFGPLTYFLIKQFDWQNIFLIYGIAFSLIIISFSTIVRNPPEGWKPDGWDSVHSKKVITPENTGMDFTLYEAIKTPEFIGMWLHYFLIISSGFAIITHAKSFAIDFSGFSPERATTLISLFSLLNFSGRLVLGPLSDRIGRINTFTIIGILMAFSTLLFPFSHYLKVPSLLYLAIIVGGIAFGGYLALSPALCADIWGLKNIGVNYGAMFTAWGIGGVFGPYFAGKIHDIFNSYDISFFVFTIISITGVLIARFFVKPKLKARIQKIREEKNSSELQDN